MMTTPVIAPELSDDLLVYRFSQKHGAAGPESESDRAVIVDRGNQVIHFRNCHTPRRFFALRAQPLVSCQFDEILAAYRGRLRGAVWVDVITPTGKARIPRTDPEGVYEELTQQLLALAPNDLRAPAEEHPLMVPVYVAGGLGGMVPLLYLMPRNSSAAVMILAGLLGIVLGIGAVFWTVRLGQGWFGVKLTLPLGLGIAGALAGLVAFFAIVCAVVEGNGIHLSILLVGGFLAGATSGAVLENRKSRGRGVAPVGRRRPPSWDDR
jgi:hypothetical protein